MIGRRRWVGTATLAMAVAPAAMADGPPSAMVDRWYQKCCPRDLTPQVVGPSYGYFETRWRIMPEDGPPAVLPPTVLPPTKGQVEPPKGKAALKSPVMIPAKASVPAAKGPPSPYAAGR